MNKKQGTLFNFGVMKSRIQGFVTQQTMIHRPQA